MSIHYWSLVSISFQKHTNEYGCFGKRTKDTEDHTSSIPESLSAMGQQLFHHARALRTTQLDARKMTLESSPSPPKEVTRLHLQQVETEFGDWERTETKVLEELQLTLQMFKFCPELASKPRLRLLLLFSSYTR